MKTLLELSDEQVRKIAALDEALDKTAAKWQADKAAKVQEAQKALFSSRDKEALVKAVQKLQELQVPYEEIVAKAGADVQSVLSAAQQAKWQEHAVIDLSIHVWFARAKLTEAQQAAVRSAYAELAKAKDAKVESIQVALAEKVRDMLSDEQLKALGPFLMQTEWLFQMSTSGPATVATGPAAKTAASVNAGLLMLPAPKLLKNGVLALGGGYAGITGPQTGGGNTIVSPEQGD